MARRFYRGNFDPVSYWASKSYCRICGERKVKYGNICHKCQEEGGWETNELTEEQIAKVKESELAKEFKSESVEREKASLFLQSIIGYLRDCAVSLLRSVVILDITEVSDKLDFLPVKEDVLELLDNGGFELKGRKASDLLYKVRARPKELQLLLGTLFLKGINPNGKKKERICAPLLYLKLEGKRTEDGSSILFTVEEDTVYVNQDLIAKLVNITEEEELEVRFQDLREAQPGWPLTKEVLNQFLRDLGNYFPEVFRGDPPQFEEFIDFEEVPLDDSIQFCPSNVLIVAPVQDVAGTVVAELKKLQEQALGPTAADCIFTQEIVSSDSAQLATREVESPKELYEKAEEMSEENQWHDLYPLGLNDEQKEIVHSARRALLTVVTGPPGTGKSYTITAIILDHLLAGRRVLFVSRMDKAVEVVVSMLEEYVGDFAVARSGGRKAQRALAEKLEHLTSPTSPVEPFSVEDLETQKKTYAEVGENLRELEKEFSDIISRERDWSEIRSSLEVLKKKVTSQLGIEYLGKERAQNLKEKVEGIKKLLEKRSFFLKTVWAKAQLKRIRHLLKVGEDVPLEELATMLEQKAEEEELGEIEEEITKLAEVNELWEQIKKIHSVLTQHASETVRKVILGNLYLLVNRHHSRSQLRKFIRSLRSANIRRKNALRAHVSTETLLSAFPCWATTTFYISQILPLEPGIFDLVIFDEASQCDLASALPALYRGTRAVVVGDPNQLTHVVFLGKQTEIAAFVNNNVPEDARDTFRFTQRSLFDVSADKVLQQDYFMLEEHFRSHPHIIGFSNERFYDNKLRLMTQRPVVEEGRCAIEVDYVDGRRTISTVNPMEIEAVFKHMEEEMKASPEDKPVSIGILCPFRDQVNAIVRELPKHITMDQMEKHSIVVGTAHSLQGDERDIVILSFSIDPDFHHGTLKFLENPNVFNVAITRAKKKLVVISSVCTKDLPEGLLKGFLEHAVCPPEKTIPEEKFDSKFERDVARALRKKGYKVWPHFEIAGFEVDLVVGKGNQFLVVECDGPYHFDQEGRQARYDIWRQKIIERAGWDVVRISDREWERDRKASVQKIARQLPSK